MRLIIRNMLTVKTFTFDVPKDLDIQGNKLINVAEPTSATDGSN